jgi:hypothetical protein
MVVVGQGTQSAGDMSRPHQRIASASDINTSHEQVTSARNHLAVQQALDAAGLPA